MPLRRPLISTAIISAAAVVLALWAPGAALADPGPVVYTTTVSGQYTVTITRDDDQDLGFTIENLSAVAMNVGLAGDLAKAGVEEDLWLNTWQPFADATQAVIQPGDTLSEDVPFWPGVTAQVYSGIDTATPTKIAEYLTPGNHVPLSIGADSTNPDNPTLEMGPPVVWSANPIAGGGIELNVSQLPPGAIDAYYLDNGAADIEWTNDDIVLENPDLSRPIGSGFVALDGTLDLKGFLPPDVAPGSAYDVIFENAGGVILHAAFGSQTTVSGTPTATSISGVTVSGNAKIGQTLTATPTGLTPASAQALYQWSANGAVIPGAAASTFTVTPAQAGTVLTVAATPWGLGDAPSAGVTSAPTAMVPALKSFTGITAPIVTATTTGQFVVGEKLHATTPAWTQSTGFAYQWLADGLPVGTGPNYIIAAANLGTTITVVATSTNPAYTPTSSESDAYGPVQPGTLKPPANTARPKISGPATPKVGSTLTAVPGSWSPTPNYAYQWMLNGTPIPGATDSTLVVPGSVGGVSALNGIISVQLDMTLAGYASETRNVSLPTAISAGTFNPKGAVAINGSPSIGATLTADPGVWDAAASLSYQWVQVSTGAVLGTGPALVVPSGTSGSKLRLTVTATADGYTTVSKSATTASKVP